MPVGGQCQQFSLQGDGLRQPIKVSVQGSEIEVIDRQIRGQQQACVFQIGRRLLGRGGGTFHQTFHASSQINFITHREVDGVITLNRGLVRGVVIGQGSAGRYALTGDAGTHAELRKQAGRTRLDRGARLRQAGIGCGQGLVACHRLDFQCIELRVFKLFPPRAFGCQVVGRARSPRALRLPSRWHICRGFDVGRGAGAANQQRADTQQEFQVHETREAHGAAFLVSALALSPLGAATLSSCAATKETSSPSVNESGGFKTIRSPLARPFRTSTFSP